MHKPARRFYDPRRSEARKQYMVDRLKGRLGQNETGRLREPATQLERLTDRALLPFREARWRLRERRWRTAEHRDA